MKRVRLCSLLSSPCSFPGHSFRCVSPHFVVLRWRCGTHRWEFLSACLIKLPTRPVRSVLQLYPLRAFHPCVHAGMKGAPSAQKTFPPQPVPNSMNESFLCRLLTQLCLEISLGRLPWVKAQARHPSARANRYMSCFRNECSRELVEPNEWYGTAHPRQDIRTRLAGVESPHLEGHHRKRVP
jgi:hypothetical protein